MKYKLNPQVRGTQILIGDELYVRRSFLNSMVDILHTMNFQEIRLPNLSFQSIFTDKAGEEVLGQMYTFADKKGRDLCLNPEGTAIIQLLAQQNSNLPKRLFYIEKFYRYERPQKGRYREFYQLGVEILNGDRDANLEYCSELACTLVSVVTSKFKLNTSVKRGLSYYTDLGFEIECEELGAQKQIVGGGKYNEGIGFAIGLDRLFLL